MPESQKSEQLELVNLRRDYGNLLLASTVLALSVIASSGPGLLLLFSAVVSKFSADTIERINGILIQLDRDQAIERLEEIFKERFKNSNATVLSRLSDNRLLLSDDPKNSVDLLISFPSELTLVVCIRAIRPLGDNRIKVYYDSPKKELGYRKSRKTGKGKFSGDQSREIRRRFNALQKKHPELFSGSSYTIGLFAEPAYVEITELTPMQILDERKYLYLKEVFFVDEAQIFPLIASLQKQTAQVETEAPKIG